MSLIGTLNVGKSALIAQQAALQVTGNNISNAGNADYSRQVVGLTAAPDQQTGQGLFIGNGVDLTSIRRQVDDALDSRLRAAVSDNQSATTSQDWLGRVEATFNALGDNNLSSQLATFFNSWSNLANKPQDPGMRQVVLTTGDNVARNFHAVRAQLTGLQSDLGTSLAQDVTTADTLATKIAQLNARVVVTEGGSGNQANDLRDQRDAAVKQLSQYIDVKTVAQDNGTVNVYVGSEPLVMGTQSRGVTLAAQTVTGPDGVARTAQIPSFKTNGGTMSIASGQIGGLLQSRDKVANVIHQVDTLANSVVFELNKVHASGQGTDGFTSVTSSNTVADPLLPLNDPKNGLPNLPNNGSFVVHVRDTATGQVTSTLVQVNLTANGSATTLDTLRQTLAGIPGVSSTVTGGRLTVAAAGSGTDISFSQDSSGTLAALGINSFYSGKDAGDIAVNPALTADPNLLAAAKNGDAGDNQTARAIAALGSQPVAALGGASLNDNYNAIVTGVGNAAAAAKTSAQAAQAVQDTLDTQRQALSGVSLDEEAINLLQQQRGFQAAARLIAAVDQMMTTVLNLVQ